MTDASGAAFKSSKPALSIEPVIAQIGQIHQKLQPPQVSTPIYPHPPLNINSSVNLKVTDASGAAFKSSKLALSTEPAITEIRQQPEELLTYKHVPLKTSNNNLCCSHHPHQGASSI